MTPKAGRGRGHGSQAGNAHGATSGLAAAGHLPPDPASPGRPLPPEAERIAPAALRTALAAIPAPAFLVRGPAAIAAANPRGEALLACEGDRVHAALRHPPGTAARAPQRFPVAGAEDWAIVVFQDVAADARARLPIVARRWGLTPRQAAVLLLVAEGSSNRAAAQHLQCSEKTVELHVSALLAKTRSTSRSQLIASFWTEAL
jgi:DNA-binding CsgD family transcriptional regulator